MSTGESSDSEISFKPPYNKNTEQDTSTAANPLPGVSLSLEDEDRSVLESVGIDSETLKYNRRAFKINAEKKVEVINMATLDDLSKIKEDWDIAKPALKSAVTALKTSLGDFSDILDEHDENGDLEASLQKQWPAIDWTNNLLDLNFQALPDEDALEANKLLDEIKSLWEVFTTNMLAIKDKKVARNPVAHSGKNVTKTSSHSYERCNWWLQV